MTQSTTKKVAGIIDTAVHNRLAFTLKWDRRARPQRRSGAALLVCIFVVTLTSAMVVAMLDAETVDMTILRNTADYDRAYYLAAAGVNHALAELEDNMNWRTGVASVQFPAGSGQTYSATVVNGTGIQVIVTGTGVAGGVTRKLQVTVEPGI